MTTKDAINSIIKSKYIFFKSIDKASKTLVLEVRNQDTVSTDHGDNHTVSITSDYLRHTITFSFANPNEKFHLILKKKNDKNEIVDTEEISFDMSAIDVILSLNFDESCNIDPADVCGLDFTSIVDFTDIKLDETKLILKDDKNAEISIEAKATALAADKIKVLKAELETQWEEQRITGNELAQAIMGGVVQLSNGSIQEALALKNSLLDSQSKILDIKLKSKQMQSDIYLSLLKAVESQEKINEIKARTQLYKEQAKGFADKTKLDSVRMVVNAWTTLYTQNQQIDVPNFAKAAQVEDTIHDWFISIGLDDPSDT